MEDLRGKTIHEKIGVCQLDAHRTVVSQDDFCRRVCGDRIGKRCKEGCMANLPDDDLPLLDQGIRTVKHIHPHAPTVDAVVIHDEDQITALLFDRSETIDRQIEFLKTFDFTPAELEILRRVLQGFSNHELCEQLFISIPTLRTHLNNIYKKIPASVRDHFLRSIGRN